MKNTYFCKHNPIVKNIFISMLAPTILMNLTTALASFADTVIIGLYLDDLSLSVVTYATPIYMIINTFAALYAVGGSIAMSIDSGKGDKKAANKSFSISVEMLIITGMLLVLGGLLFGNNITHLLGAGTDVFDMVHSYSTIVMVGAPIFMLNIGLAFFVRNDGRPTLSMVGMFLSIIVNIVFDVVFIGFLGLGVAGAAYATVLGQLVSVLVIASHFLSSKNTLRFSLTFNKSALRIVQNGASTALHFVYQFLTILILNHLVSNLAGTNGVVIYTVVFNLYTVSLALFEGISQTIQPMISLYYGEKSYIKIKDTLRLAFITIAIICGSVTVLLEIIPQIVPIIFGIDDSTLLQGASLAVRIFATSIIIMTVNVVIGYYLQSTEHSFMSAFLVSLRCFALFLVGAFVLGRLFGLNGIWGAYTFAEIITFIIFIIVNQIERSKLIKKGTNANLLLLDSNIEKNTSCFTFACEKDNFDDFKKEVFSKLKNTPQLPNYVFLDTQQYLLRLCDCNTNKKGKYIEVEINAEDKKVIIRDNLNHTDFKENISDFICNGSKTDYNPVLGWNRICLE